MRLLGLGFWLVSTLVTLASVTLIWGKILPDQALVLSVSGPTLLSLDMVLAFRGREKGVQELELVCLPSLLTLTADRLGIFLGSNLITGLLPGLFLWADGSKYNQRPFWALEPITEQEQYLKYCVIVLRAKTGELLGNEHDTESPPHASSRERHVSPSVPFPKTFRLLHQAAPAAVARLVHTSLPGPDGNLSGVRKLTGLCHHLYHLQLPGAAPDIRTASVAGLHRSGTLDCCPALFIPPGYQPFSPLESPQQTGRRCGTLYRTYPQGGSHVSSCTGMDQTPARILEHTSSLLWVIMWELRRARTSRLFRVQISDLSVCMLLLIWLLRIPEHFNIYPIAGANPHGLLVLLPTLLVGLILLLPFLTTDGVTRDHQRHTYERFMVSTLPTWIAVWERYLANLLISNIWWCY